MLKEILTGVVKLALWAMGSNDRLHECEMCCRNLQQKVETLTWEKEHLLLQIADLKRGQQ